MILWIFIIIAVGAMLTTFIICMMTGEGIDSSIGLSLAAAFISSLILGLILIIISAIAFTNDGGYEREYTKLLHEYPIAPAFEAEGGFEFSIGIGELDGKEHYVMYIKVGDDRKTFRQFVLPAEDCKIVLSENKKPTAKRDALWKVYPWWLFGGFRDLDGFEYEVNKWQIIVPNNTLFRVFKLEN